MKIHLAQYDTAWESKGENFSRIEALLAETPPQEGSLLVLPEMFSTGFSLNADKTHEGHHHPSEKFMRSLASTHKVAVLGGVTNLSPKGRPLNQALAVAPPPSGEGAGMAELCRYTKVHPFGPGGESKDFAAGSLAMVFDWGGFKVSPFVCYDLRFPEIFRKALRLGAELMVVIANWPRSRVEHWETLLKARAIENQCFVAGVNRCGKDPTQDYPGRSLVFGPRGEPIAQAGSGPELLTADLDRDSLLAYRTEFPVLKDMK